VLKFHVKEKNMEPIKPEVRKRILDDHPQASPEDIDEYERLLSQRFEVDPDLPMAPALSNQRDADEERLAELYDKLFSNP
jgi:hypothetical protein